MRMSMKERFEKWWTIAYPNTTAGKSAAWLAWLTAWDEGYGERCYEERCAR